MNNLATVIAVAIKAPTRQIVPCVKVLSGAYRAAIQQEALYRVNLSFSFTSGGVHIGPIVSQQALTQLVFVASLDAYYTRARGTAVALPSLPDPHTPMVCTATLQYPNAEGIFLDCGPADTTAFYPTFGH